MNDDVAVTGVGLVTGFGDGIAQYWNGLATARSAAQPAASFTSSGYRGEPVVEAEFDTGDKPAEIAWRRRRIAELAVAGALRSARLRRLADGAPVVVVGQAPPASIPAVPDWNDVVWPAVSSLAGGSPAPIHLSHACASAAFAVAFVRSLIRGGVAPMALVTGSFVLNRFDYDSMDVVRALSPTAAKPFDEDRRGLTLGEGGGAVVVESAEHAYRRGRPPQALVAGTCCRVGGVSPTASDDNVVAECMLDAIADADCGKIDYVHAHATGTIQGDAAELRALERVATELGVARLPVSSHKGAIGHLLHASVLPGLAAAVIAIRTGFAPPTSGLDRPESTDRVELVRGSAVHVGRMSTVMVNGFGFGGNNASLVLTRAG
jgi:3-oxoacyl-[acyl-carrier-protein] synthase II